MLKALDHLYREGWRYALACPLLVLVPVVAEAAQHVVEFAQGMYDGVAGAKAAQGSGLRLGFGIVKILSLLLSGYWMTRWLEWRQPARVGAFDRAALRAFVPLLALEITVELAGLLLIYGQRPVPWKLLVSLLGPLLIALALADWRRTAPLGAKGGPWISLRLVVSILPWAFAFNLLAELPLLIAHYGLGFVAIKGSAIAKPIVLLIDSLLVGYLSAVLSGVPWHVSERARTRTGAAAPAPPVPA